MQVEAAACKKKPCRVPYNGMSRMHTKRSGAGGVGASAARKQQLGRGLSGVSGSDAGGVVGAVRRRAGGRAEGSGYRGGGGVG